MAEYDGSVIIKTALDSSGLSQGAEALKKSAQGVVQMMDAAIQRMNAGMERVLQGFAKINAAYNQHEAQLQKLRQETAEVTEGGRRTPAATGPRQTDEYKAVNAEIEKLDKRLDAAAEKVDKMVALYGQANVEGMRSFQSLQYDFMRMQEQYDELIKKREELEKSGRAYYTPMIASAPARQAKETVAAEAMQKRLAAAEEKHNATLEKLNNNYLTLRDRMDKVGKEGVKAHTATAKHTGISFKKILQYGFGIRSVFALFRRLRNAAKESLGVMAQYDPELNKTVSKFMTSAKQLKADMGTVLQPLIQKLAPIVTALLDRIHDGLIAISQFFAALVGQNYIEVATVETVDWAGALNDVADSAAKVEKSLGSYDKLNVISSSAEDEAKAAKNNMQLTKDTVKYTKQALDNDKWYVKLGRSLSGVFQSALDWLKKQMEDPEKFLTTLGVSALGIKLGGMLLGGIGKSGFGTGLTALLPKVLTVAVTAVIGYKIGEKIWNSLPEGLKDEMADVVGEYVKAWEEAGIQGVLERFSENVVTVLEIIKEKFFPTKIETHDLTVPENFFAWQKSPVDALRQARKTGLPDEVMITKWGFTEEQLKEAQETLKKEAEKAKWDLVKSLPGFDLVTQMVDFAEGVQDDNTDRMKHVYERTFKEPWPDAASPGDKEKKTIQQNVVDSLEDANKTAALKTRLSLLGGKLKEAFGGTGTAMVQALKAAFGFTDKDTNDMADEVAEAADTAGKAPTVINASKRAGTKVASTIANAVKYTEAQLNEANERTGELVSNPPLEKVKKTGKTIAKDLVQSIDYTDDQKKGVQERTSDLTDGQPTDTAKKTGKSLVNAIVGAFTFSKKDKQTTQERTDELVTGQPTEAAATAGANLAKAFLAAFKFTNPEKAEAKNETSTLVGTTGAPETAAKTGGRTLAGSVVGNYKFSNLELATAKIRTAALANVSGAPENAAKTGGRSLITSLLSMFTFTDKDKKDSAGSLAEGLNGVANEAGRSGSPLYNALKGIGAKIAEGINKGTVTVPVTFAGTTVPKGTALQNAVNKFNSQVTIQLDGKTISEVVFDEAGKKVKQIGNGAAAIVKFLASLGGT